MKVTELKKIIKESVREAIQDELKVILLEALKAPNVKPINEHFAPVNLSSTPSTMIDRKKAYQDILGETALNFSSKDVVRSFNPNASVDSINGALPEGDLNMDQILGLLNNK
jgi:hypothetical protein